MLAEYAFTYGGPPPPDMPWPTFMALIKRAGMFEARALMRQMDGTLWAIGQAFDGKQPEALSLRQRLERIAYPWEKRDPFVIRGSEDA